jgi:hypothetical protein
MRIRTQELTECVSSTKTLVDGTQKSIEKILFFKEGLAKTLQKRKFSQKRKLREIFREKPSGIKNFSLKLS